MDKGELGSVTDDGAADGYCKNVRARAFRGHSAVRLPEQRDRPKQIRTRSTTSIWPYSAQPEPTHHGGDYQVGVVVGADKDY